MRQLNSQDPKDRHSIPILKNGRTITHFLVNYFEWKAINYAPAINFMEMILSELLDGSGNSEDLYLYTTTTQKFYTENFAPAIENLKELLDKRGSDLERFNNRDIYTLRSILWSVVLTFDTATEMYHKEIKPDNFWDKTFTPLDIYTCAFTWIRFYINEYTINGLK